MVIKKNLNKKFGSYIRELRIKNGIGQRELADKVGIAASYLNDIEKEKRTAPKQIVIKKLNEYPYSSPLVIDKPLPFSQISTIIPMNLSTKLSISLVG